MSAGTADLTTLAQNFSEQTGIDYQKAAAAILESAAKEVQALAMASAPVKTGALKNSIRITVNSPLNITIGPRAIYGVYQEFGTGSRGEFGGSAYKIRPVNGKYLKFKVDGNKVVFAKEVTHPGIKPHPYMRPALEKVIKRIAPELANTAAVQITRGLHAK